MSGFQVGDVVVRVRGRGVKRHEWPADFGPRAKIGAVGRVVSVFDHWCGVQGLIVEPWPVPPGYAGWPSSYWRKIRPASDEFSARIRACRPERIGEPA